MVFEDENNEEEEVFVGGTPADEENKREESSKTSVSLPLPQKKPQQRFSNRTLVMIFANFLVILLGLLLFDILGFYKITDNLLPIVKKVPGMKRVITMRPRDDSSKLASMERSKQDEAIKEAWKEIAGRMEYIERLTNKINSRNIQIDKEWEYVKTERDAMEKQRQATLEEQAELSKIAQQYIAMPPKSAVAQLTNMDNASIVDILIAVEEIMESEGQDSIVPYWLTLITPERSAELQELRRQRPTFN